MKLLVSRLQHERNGYFGEADSFTNFHRGLGSLDLLHDLRTSALLYDRVFLAAAYFWQSREVQDLLPHVRTLVQSGAVLPTVRDPRATRDVEEYFDQRLSDFRDANSRPRVSNPALAAEKPREQQRSIARSLDELGAVVHIDGRSVEQAFRRLWRLDCWEHRLTFSVRNLVYLHLDEPRWDQTLDRLRRLGERQAFSRLEIAGELAQMSIPDSLVDLLLVRTTSLYLAANARVCNAELIVTSASEVSQGVVEDGSEAPFAPTMAIRVFDYALEAVGLRLPMLDALSEEDLLVVKHSEEFRAFVARYLDVVRAVSAAESRQREVVWNAILNTRRDERRLRRALWALRQFERGAVGVLLAAIGANLGGAPGTGEIVVASGGVSGVLRLLTSLKKLDTAPTIDFEAFLIRRSYAQLRPWLNS